MRRLAVLAVAVLAAAGCWPQGPEHSTLPCGADKPAPDLYLFGDSLAVDARPAACVGFAAAGLDVSYNVVPGTQIDHWADAMAAVPAGAPVVVALGSNDVLNNDRATIRGDIDTTLDRLGHARCQVWLTVSQYSAVARGWPYDVRTSDLDARLRNHAASGQYPNLQLAEWSIASNGHPEYLKADRLHHTPAGQVAYAGHLVAAAGSEGCA